MSTTAKPSNSLQAKQRQETDDKVVAAIEAHGPLSVYQISIETGLARTTVELSIARLRGGGTLRILPGKRQVGKKDSLASVYDVGIDEDSFLARGPVEFKIHRHPQDVALFGEHRSAA